MSLKVDTEKLGELSAKLKSLGNRVEYSERRIYQDIYRLLKEIRDDYNELAVQRALDDVENRLHNIEILAKSVTDHLYKRADGLKQVVEAYLDSEKRANNATRQKFVSPSSYYSKDGFRDGQGSSSYLKDPLFEDPVVQKLHVQILNGTEKEKKEAKRDLDSIFKARYDIARTQVAYSVYEAFHNKPLMNGAHKEAERLRQILRDSGVQERLFNENIDLTSYFTGSPIAACSYDPSFQITKGNNFVPILMPRDNQYSYLLGLAIKEGPEGTWAKTQLNEIHKLLNEIGRSQVAWHEYKAKNMHSEMEGAHIYAEKLRTTLKQKYSLSPEIVDDADYRMLWMGAGSAGKHLEVEDTGKLSSVTLTTADDYRQALIEEAKYWIGKIPYCRDTKITTQRLDRDNPPPYMDCADFTSSLYKTLLNINIGATTRIQITRGTRVEINDFKPGDLILFGNKKKGIPSHVGIYIGNGEFIHEVGDNTNPNNLTKKKWNVRIDKLTNSYWNPKIIMGRRIIQDNDMIINLPSSKAIPLPQKKVELDAKPNSPSDDVISDYDFKKELSNFPESYRPMLEKLHRQHPTWRFYADRINADFKKLVAAEIKSGHVCTIEEKYGYEGKWRDPKFNYDKGYFAASEKAVAYFIDPRNFINETQIFQFLSAKYDKNTQNLDAVNSVIRKSKLSNKGNAFLQAGGDKVSAVFLAAKSSVETDRGRSKLATGNVPGYNGWYNMYGIGANDGNAGSGGAKKAKSEGWNTQDKAIIGGGNWINKNYVNSGQDALYKMKWNIEGFAKNGSINHQYATHIKDAYNKAANFAKGLKETEAPLVFRIPVYQEMPNNLSAEPRAAQSK